MAKITCKPEYAYGSAGSAPDIPPEYVTYVSNLLILFQVYCQMSIELL